MKQGNESYFVYPTRVGDVCISANTEGVTGLSFDAKEFPGLPRKATSLTNAAANELQEYLAKKRRDFDVPLCLKGSEFQLQVWNAIRSIPFGQSLTCTELAEQLGGPGKNKAVGSAIAANRVPILIPDHRIAQNGKPCGSGKVAQRRSALLLFEENCLDS